MSTEAAPERIENPFLEAGERADSPFLSSSVPGVEALVLSVGLSDDRPLLAFEAPRTERSPSDAPPAPEPPVADVKTESAAFAPAPSPKQRLISEAPTPLTPFEAFAEEDIVASSSAAHDAPSADAAALPPPTLEALAAPAAESIPRAPKLVQAGALPKLVPASPPRLALPPPFEAPVAATAPDLEAPLSPVAPPRAEFGGSLGVADGPERSSTPDGLASRPTPKRSIPPPPPSARGARPSAPVMADTTAVDDGWDLPAAPADPLAVPVAPIAAPLVAFTDDAAQGDLTRPLPVVERGRDDAARDDLTRPLPPIVLVRVEPLAGSDVDVTNPLPAPVEPYTSDTELTRPVLSSNEAEAIVAPAPPPSLRLPVPKPPPLRSPSTASLPPPPTMPSRPVPVVVSKPPPSSAPMHHPPSIEIAAHANRRSSVPPPPMAQRSASPSARPDGLTTMPRIPRPARVPHDFEAPRARRSSIAPTTGSIPPLESAPRSRNRWLVALAAMTLGGAALGVGLRSRPGALVVTVAGPDGTPAKNIAITIDGVTRCEQSPCEVPGLAAGVHLLSASAAGLPASAERAFSLEPGQRAAEHVVLMPAAHREVAGLTVSATGDGLSVFVDGKNLGAPPVSLRDVEPGTHTVRVVGPGSAYEPYEQTVKVDTGELRSLGPVRLRLLHGRLHLEGGDGADAATTFVDGRRVQLPATLELSPDESHEVKATRPGFTPFEQEVVFDASADRSVVVSLEPASGTGRTSGAPRVARNTPVRSAPVTRAASTVQGAAPQGAMATLDINSIPRANVVVNGRPLGATPLTGIRVPAGTQTIVFVHPTLGRKIASTTVAAGSRKAAFVKF